MPDENIIEVVENVGTIKGPVIDMSGTGETEDDPFELKPGSELMGPKEEVKDQILDKPAETKPEEGEKKEKDETAPPEGEKGKELPEKFVEVFSDFVEDPEFKDITLEDGKKLVTEMIQSRIAFDKTVNEFAQDKQQFIEMSNLLDSDKDLAAFVWDVIDRKKKGLPMLKTEEDLEREEMLTPEQKQDRERLAALETDSKNRKLNEDINYYRQKIDEIHNVHLDPETKKSPFSESDIDIIADLAIRHKTDDLMGIAKTYLQDRQRHIDNALKAAKEKFREEVKPEIIKEYLNLKEVDRQKIIDSSVKPAGAPPAQPAKRLSLEDDSAKQGFLASIRASISGK